MARTLPQKINLTPAQKKRLAGKQNFQCANIPGALINNLHNYKCPLWQRSNARGNFGESGYDIDHIIEKAAGGTDEESNLHALCMDCHAVKTGRFQTIILSKDGITKPTSTKFIYKCHRCLYETPSDKRYVRHLRRKIPCKKRAGAQVIDLSNVDDEESMIIEPTNFYGTF